MLKGNSLEEQLRKWRESKAEKHTSSETSAHTRPAAPPKDRRTVRVNGQDVVVVKKISRRVAPKHPES
jgi:hypothetical protein